jgi:hypothetical protein
MEPDVREFDPVEFQEMLHTMPFRDIVPRFRNKDGAVYSGPQLVQELAVNRFVYAKADDFYTIIGRDVARNMFYVEEQETGG